MREDILNVQGLQVSYRTAGEGPAILILHGWGSRSDRWIRVMELLSDNKYSVIIPDLPGFGKSETPKSPWSMEDYYGFVKEFADRLGLKEFYLLGHSFGGGLALFYATKHPEKVKKLFLISAAIKRKKSLRKSIFKMLSRIGKVFSFLPFYSLFKKAFYKYVVKKSDYPYQAGVMKGTYLKVIGQDLSPFLTEIRVPTIVLWGEKDDYISVKDAHFIAEHITDAKLVLVPEGDHDLERKMPEILTQKILSFL